MQHATASQTSDLGALHLLQALGQTVALVSADLRLLACAASAAAGFNAVFRQVGSRVVFYELATRRRFDAVIGRAGPGSQADGEWFMDVFVQRREQATPLLIRIMACPHDKDDGDAGERAALLIVLDLQQDRYLPEHLVKAAFGLTAAEAALAADLTNGQTLREIGGETRVCISTLRSHLSGVLAKTGTTRQANLVRLLAHLSVSAASLESSASR